MPEYTYLLETRLNPAQRNALAQVRDAAREAGMTVFLAGGAVRDLTTGSSVRDLDFAVQGNALQLREALQARGAALSGQHEPSRTLFFSFPGSVRVEVTSTRSESYPKPGQPLYQWSGIVDDLHRRDFTANAMALSLNEGSYGLLLDPLNGVADIEARQLRLVSNYGFLDDPSRMVRLVRLRRRLGWTVEERTAARYENAKDADIFGAVSAFLRGYELEEVAAEEDALHILRALGSEGWMEKLFPAWSDATVDTAALEDLHRNRIQLLIQGIAPDLTAAHLEVLTAKMGAEERHQLKAAMVREGLRAQWEGLDEAAREFARLLTGKEAATPSATWKLFHAHPAEPILWLAHGRKSPAVEAKFKNLFTVWPEVAKKVPVAMMTELRITPDLPEYNELLHQLFLQQIDGKLDTDEAMRAFLEPYSPPAPPPPVTLKRTRGKKSDSKVKRKGGVLDEEDTEGDERSASGEEIDDEEDEPEDGPRELGLNRRTGGLDLGEVLGRIESEPDEEPEDESEKEGRGPTRNEEGMEAETTPPAPLVKNEPPVPAPVALPVTVDAAPVPTGKGAPAKASKKVAQAGSASTVPSASPRQELPEEKPQIAPPMKSAVAPISEPPAAADSPKSQPAAPSAKGAEVAAKQAAPVAPKPKKTPEKLPVPVKATPKSEPPAKPAPQSPSAKKAAAPPKAAGKAAPLESKTTQAAPSKRSEGEQAPATPKKVAAKPGKGR